MPLGISGTFNFMIVFQAEHNPSNPGAGCGESRTSGSERESHL
jgi:hypothetical protein